MEDLRNGLLPGRKKEEEPGLFAAEPDQAAEQRQRRNAEPEEPAAGARIYVVQPGDCLWTIARQELGGGLRWVEIYDANRDQIQDPDRIQAGMELELPA